MVTLLAARLGVPLIADDGALAANLMAGIVMDTATFAHPNATPRTLAVSAALPVITPRQPHASHQQPHSKDEEHDFACLLRGGFWRRLHSRRLGPVADQVKVDGLALESSGLNAQRPLGAGPSSRPGSAGVG